MRTSRKTYLFSLFLIVLLFAPAFVYAGAGDLDSDFDGDGKVITDFGTTHDLGYAIALQNDGKILVAGYAMPSTYCFAMARYMTDGSLDPAFGGGDGMVTTCFGVIATAAAITIQPDGKILLAGHVENPGNYDFALVRYKLDGSLDTLFGDGGKVTTDFAGGNDNAYSVLIDANGKILAGGTSEGNFAVARYNSDGSLDTSFSVDGKVTTDFYGQSDSGRSLAIQPDGKILMGGQALLAVPDWSFGLVRYNTDGTLDMTFGTDGKTVTDLGGADGIYDIKLLANGKIIVAGGTNAFTASTEWVVARYNPDGTLDTSFGTNGYTVTEMGSSDNWIYFAALQTDGKIIVSGKSSANDFAIARYTANGTLDTTFGISGIVITDINGTDESFGVAIQPDGRIVVAGQSDWADFAVARYLGDPAPTCTYSDNFEDGIRPANWTYTKPEWTESGGNLIGTPTGRKAEAIATPAFAGCSTCSFETTMSTAGGTMNKVWMLAWYAGKADTIEVLMKEENNKWVMKQKVNGRVAVKAAAPSPIEPDTFYTVRVTFDGTNFTLDVNGTTIATMPAAVAPNGTAGFRVKNTTGSFGSICID